MKKNSLAEKNPELAKEWHPTLNGDLTPWDVTCGMAKKVWWQCSEHVGHKWEAVVYSRTSGRGCPYCSGQKILPGYNDLATTHPELAKEWHSTLNGDLTPANVTAGMAKKVWWQCGKCRDHQWETRVSHKSNGSGCPFCSGFYPIKGETDLATTQPELANEWHPTLNGDLTPADVTAGSNVKVWWQCSEYPSHEWTTMVNGRNRGGGCPYCSGNKVMPNFNDLATINPSLAKEWHPSKNGELSPSSVTAGSHKKVWWICNEKHAWKTAVCNRKQGKNCPYCVNQKLLIGYNDLATCNSALAEEWHPTLNDDLTPSDVVVGSSKTVWWRCKRGHEWKSAIAHRNKGRGCKKCLAEQQTSFPEQAICFYIQQVVPVENRASVFGVEIDVFIPSWGIGIEYDGIYYHDSEKGKAREDKKNQILIENGIKLIRIKETLNVVDNTSDTIYCMPGSSHKQLNPMFIVLESLLSEMKGIPISLNADVSRDNLKIVELYVENEKQNSLSVKNPTVAAEWHPFMNGRLKPEFLSAGSSQKVWWQCRNHKEHCWKTTPASRVGGSGCPYCSRRYAAKGETDLATTHPLLAEEWHPALNGDLKSIDVVAGSNRKVWWQCAQNHQWKAGIASRKNGYGHCPECKKQRRNRTSIKNDETTAP